VIILAAMMFASCTAKETPRGVGAARETGGAKEPAKRNVVIGFSIATDTFIIERWNKDLKIFAGAAKELGAEIIAQLSAGGTKEQIAQINYLLGRKIDVLVVVTHDMEMLAGVVKQVRDTGIPVVAYDRMIMGVPIDAYISFDNKEVGRLFGRALKAAVPRGRYLVVNGSVRDNNSYEVHAGLFEIIGPLINAGDIKIVKDIWLEEWSFDEALEKIGKVLNETTDIDAISCGNDQIAAAAVQLLSERRLAGKVAVVGQDADLINCQRVVEGTQLMTVYKPIQKLATRAAHLAMALSNGTAIPCDKLIDNKSGALIPSYIEAPIAVYKSNMNETVVKDGFHSSEDVYRNVIGQ
jgi:D-xylose transport system substrate-binding protein